ncbi:MAG: sigma-54 interaction domain-containing protein, partial [bacterium]
ITPLPHPQNLLPHALTETPQPHHPLDTMCLPSTGNVLLKSEFHKMYAFDDIIGRSKSMQAVFGLVSKVLDSDTSVLVEGESGTGKELIAKTIHYNGKRKGRPFVPVNCSAIPETLLESELFGHKKGSFTGAVQDKKGLFEVADSGTLFLDEIGDITLPMQAKLLRVLQEREIRRIGETSSRNVDVRIIAATNKNLVEEIKAGRFREDLYYRLNVINILMPPLRERRKDIPLLAHHFLKKHAKLAGKRIKGFSSAALDHLVGYNWPGNVRELENTIERAVVLAQGELVEADDLFSAKPPPTDVLETGISLKECERRLIEKTLREAEGNKTRAARILGISLRTLHNKLKEWEDEDHRPV